MTVIHVPGSKSVTARALFLAAAANGRSTLVRPLASDDTEGFAAGLTALGYEVEREADVWHITGRPAGPAATEADVYCRDGATTARFLPTLAAAGARGSYRFDASAQMRRRPSPRSPRPCAPSASTCATRRPRATTRCASRPPASRAANSPWTPASPASTSPPC